MRRIVCVAAGFSALLLSGAVAAQNAAPAPIDKAAKPHKERKVCRSEEVTGSLLPSSTCRTAAEWAAIDKQQREATQADLRGRQVSQPH